MPLGTIVDRANDSSIGGASTGGGSPAVGDGSGGVGEGVSVGVGAGEGVGDGVGEGAVGGVDRGVGWGVRVDGLVASGSAEIDGAGAPLVCPAVFSAPAGDADGFAAGFGAADGRGAGACAAVVTVPAPGGAA
jgi:hypothetical protein